MPHLLAQVRDHPRVCGEQLFISAALSIAAGSPPRVRGAAKTFSLKMKKGGITPACAGSRSLPGYGGTQVSDHPRVCGEQASR